MIAQATVKGKDAKAGQHTIVIGPGQLGQMFAANIMRPDPSHKYVLVSADQNGALNAADIGNPPQAEFRIWLLGAVTNGYSYKGANQPWVDQMAAQLTADGYDYVYPDHWEPVSDVAQPLIAVHVGQAMAGYMQTVVQNAINAGTIGPNDVVDLHFIGHSRGSVVIGVAFQTLTTTTIPQLQHGYDIMTMLDPHPANNAFGDWRSSILGKVIGAGVYNFQSGAVDPNVAIPANVRLADDFWQHSPVKGLSGIEGYINLWGESPSQISNPLNLTILSYPLTGQRLPNGTLIGHSEVEDYYMIMLQSNNFPPEITPF